MKKVDLNCDLGESFGRYTLGNDAEILNYVSSANVACGYHAGDPSTMRRTVHLCLEKGVAIGAHPGYPDLMGFGRREMKATPDEVRDMVVYQIGALWAFVRAAGGHLHHVKPHGALYNVAARDKAIARAIAEAVYSVNPELVLYGLSGSASIAEAHSLGLRTASEVFADRTYQEDASLTPRTQNNALIEEDDLAVAQVLRMVRDGSVLSLTGQSIAISADTVCIHGDGAHALSFAARLHRELEDAGVQVSAG